MSTTGGTGLESAGSRSAAEEVLRARAYLSRVAEPGSVPVWAWVRKHGPVAAAGYIRAGTVPDDVRAQTEARAATSDPDADLEAAARHGIRLVTPESPDWPHFALGALDRMGEDRLARYLGGERTASRSGEPVPPLALWVRGRLPLAGIGVRAVAIVGARAATAYGLHISSEIGYGVAREDVCVVSGGAYGIDAAAHRAALAADGATVLVSAAGLDTAYPAGNHQLYDQVAEVGLLVSESPPGATPQRHRFLSRNRLIAAFGSATVVVEAAHRSGAMNTAHHAVTLGRPLLAVPGPITSPMSVGCHRLIQRERDPAQLVGSVEDVLAVVGPIGGYPPDRPGDVDVATTRAAPDTADDPLVGLPAAARLVLDGLPARSWARPDAIAVRSGVALRDVLRVLPALELAGLAEQSDGGFRVAARVRAGATGGRPIGPRG